MIYDKLSKIQQLLKAPKNQYNKFGNFYYRNCEDILEAVKPIAAGMGCVVTVSDEIVQKGDRYYIEATASLINIENGERAEVKAYAREEESKKGMDASQVTGSTSSYARKYALSGLFAIDDNKDADTQQPEEKPEPTDKRITCDCCGAVIFEYRGTDGNPVTPEAHKRGSVKKFGRVLCLDCINDLKNENAGR